MSRFGDFAAIWFGTLVALNFAVFPALGAPLGMGDWRAGYRARDD